MIRAYLWTRKDDLPWLFTTERMANLNQVRQILIARLGALGARVDEIEQDLRSRLKIIDTYQLLNYQIVPSNVQPFEFWEGWKPPHLQASEANVWSRYPSKIVVSVWFSRLLR